MFPYFETAVDLNFIKLLLTYTNAAARHMPLCPANFVFQPLSSAVLQPCFCYKTKKLMRCGGTDELVSGDCCGNGFGYRHSETGC